MKVEVSGLTKSYDGHVAVDSLDLVAEEGKLTTLLGPSGCGKTTALRCIAGLELPDGGQISIGDDVVEDAERGISVPVQRRNVGFVFQSFDVWPHMSVFENVAYPLRVRNEASEEIRRRVTDILELAGIGDHKDQQASTLSGGQRARVGLCRALVYEPKVLLCDEPLTGLDRKLRKRLRQELRRIQSDLGITTIYVTHDQPEAMALSDKLALMNTDGKIEQFGSPEEIYQNPSSEYGFEFIGDTQTLRGEVVDSTTVETSIGAVSCRASGASKRDVVVGFRPESVTVVPDANPSEDNVWRGTVQNEYYLGERYELDVLVEDELVQAQMDVDEYSRLGLEEPVGSEILIRLEPSKIHVFDRRSRETPTAQ